MTKPLHTQPQPQAIRCKFSLTTVRMTASCLCQCQNFLNFPCISPSSLSLSLQWVYTFWVVSKSQWKKLFCWVLWCLYSLEKTPTFLESPWSLGARSINRPHCLSRQGSFKNLPRIQRFHSSSVGDFILPARQSSLASKLKLLTYLALCNRTVQSLCLVNPNLFSALSNK